MSGDRNCLLKTETGGNVLVVDDDPVLRALATRWLTGEGYPCTEAEDAEEAWARLSEEDIHLVTLDITMPGRSGIDLLGDIHKAFPDTAVVMMTAMADTELAIEALTHGACGYLVKPVDREDLLPQARSALERRRSILENRQNLRSLEEKIRDQVLATRCAQEETIHRLVGASMYRDEETGAHIRRVGLYAEAVAQAAGWSLANAEMLRMTAPMHDVGKIGIPDAILQKPCKLTQEEFRIMQSHAVIGASMLTGGESPMLLMAHDIALNHHERWDGTGYPNGIAGTAIPECARIVAIADVYDALTHDRVYRPAFSEREALAIVENRRGTHFDPSLLESFFNSLPDIRRIAKENPDESGQCHFVHRKFPSPPALQYRPQMIPTA